MPHGSWTNSEVGLRRIFRRRGRAQLRKDDHTHDPKVVAPEVVGHLMRPDFPSVRPNTSVETARTLMERNRLDLLPMVQSDGRLLGVLLKRDIDATPGGEAATNAGVTVTAAELARHDIPCAEYEEPVSRAVEDMALHDVTALPVASVSAHGEHVDGLVLLADLRSHENVVTQAPIAVAHDRLSPQTQLSAVATLGTILLALWMLHPLLGAPAWMSWLDLTAAIVAFASAATWRTPGMIGLALSAFLSISLMIMFLFGRLIGGPPSLIWSHLALACGFLAVTIVAALEPDGLRFLGARTRPRPWPVGPD